MSLTFVIIGSGLPGKNYNTYVCTKLSIFCSGCTSQEKMSPLSELPLFPPVARVIKLSAAQISIGWGGRSRNSSRLETMIRGYFGCTWWATKMIHIVLVLSSGGRNLQHPRQGRGQLSFLFLGRRVLLAAMQVVVLIVGDGGEIWNFVTEVVKLVYQIHGTSLGVVAQVFRSFDELTREAGYDLCWVYGNGADDDGCVGARV